MEWTKTKDTSLLKFHAKVETIYKWWLTRKNHASFASHSQIFGKYRFDKVTALPLFLILKQNGSETTNKILINKFGAKKWIQIPQWTIIKLGAKLGELGDRIMDHLKDKKK